jgi:hypothetical protein
VQIAIRRHRLDLESTSQHAPREVKEGLWAPTRLQAGNLTAIKSISQQLYCSDSLLLRHQSKEMAPTTRAGSPTKGKARATTETSDYDDQEESRLFEQALETPSGGAIEDTPLMRQANMMALKRS